MTDRYAVMGNPIAHSKSPLIHQRFAEQTGQDLSYEKILVPLDGFAEAVTVFQTSGGKGLNITVPFKQQAFTLATELSERAQQAGAVNTLIFKEDNKLFGDNTDGVGLVKDLVVNHQIILNDKRILLLGAGGAARGVLGSLLAEKPKQLFIANRTASKATELAKAFVKQGTINGGGFAELPEGTFDVVINATAASLTDELPPLSPECVSQSSCCYDMAYAKEPTAFLKWAATQNVATCLDGLGMLVEQAAESFYLWRGTRVQTAAVLVELRSQVGFPHG